MRRPVALVALGASLVMGAAASEVVSAAAPPPAPIRVCSDRIEIGAPPRQFARAGDVVIGPVVFEYLQQLEAIEELRRHRSGDIYLVKSPLGVLASRRVTVVVGAGVRRRASLFYAAPRARSVDDGSPAVTFQACSIGHRAFGYDGSVGIKTTFAGGFILSEPTCVPLEVWVRGRRAPFRRTVGFGVADCPSEESADAPVLFATNVDRRDVRRHFGPSIRRASWDGPLVTRVKAGTYRIRLHDNSSDANWRFTGPGVALRSTFAFVGFKSFTVQLRPGRYVHSRLGRENGVILPQPDGFQRRLLTVVR